MKYLYIATLILLVSCKQSNNHSDKNEAANSDSLSKTSEIITEKTISLTDKTVKFLWRDSNNSIVINHEFCKTISAPEKAALGYVATFIGNECWWEDRKSTRLNSSHVRISYAVFCLKKKKKKK